jgi:hypothetical protein
MRHDRHARKGPGFCRKTGEFLLLSAVAFFLLFVLICGIAIACLLPVPGNSTVAFNIHLVLVVIAFLLTGFIAKLLDPYLPIHEKKQIVEQTHKTKNDKSYSEN